MGERYQTHIIVNFDKDSNKENFIFSIHMQWCWGVHIIRNIHRLMNTLKKSNLEYIYERELIQYIEGILIVNKSLDNKHYFFRIHTGKPYLTNEGDSNHGWSVLKLDISEKGKVTVTSRFYSIESENVSNGKLWSDCKREFDYYKYNEKDIKKVKKLLDCGLFNNTKEDLQSLFNGGVRSHRVRMNSTGKGGYDKFKNIYKGLE